MAGGTCLVKDESLYDRFDRVFSAHFKGVEDLFGPDGTDIPEEWLRKQVELGLSDEEKVQIEAMGGWEKLMETLKKRLEEQDERHQGGSKWVGTAGTSPFGAYGYNPEGVRIGQEGSRHRRAVKAWDMREFKHLEYFYIHNCIYEGLWKDNKRRHSVRIPTTDVLHKYSAE